jgi:hypothetical protein
MKLEDHLSEITSPAERTFMGDLEFRFPRLKQFVGGGRLDRYYWVEEGRVTNLYLSYIDLSNETPELIEEILKYLPKLKYLGLTECNLSKNLTLLKELGKLEDLKRLEILGLSKNALTEIPFSFDKLRNLKDLDIDQNKLSDLPESFEELNSLERLSIGDNNFTEFPKGILKCKKIKMLNFSDNHLKEIPEGISELAELEHIALGEIT